MKVLITGTASGIGKGCAEFFLKENHEVYGFDKNIVAEGKKESAILDAEAEKQAAILKAEAQKERMIKEAEGQAEAVLKVQKANAEGIRMIREAGADQAVLTLKSLEAFGKAADGKATKIIIPSEIQGLAGLASSLKEIVVEDKKTEE